MEKLYGGAFIIYLQALYSSLGGALFLFVILRFITQEQVGVYSGFGIIVGAATVLSSLALPFAINQAVPKLLKDDRKMEVAALVRRTLALALLISGSASAITYAMSGFIAEQLLGTEYTNIIVLGAIDIPILALQNLATAFMISIRRFRAFGIAAITGATIRYGLGALLLVSGVGLEGIIYAIIVGDAFILIAEVIWVVRAVGRRSRRPSDEYGIREMIRTSSPIYANNIINYFQSTMERFAILFVSNPAVLGVYSVALVSMTPVRMIASSFRRVALVDFSVLGDAAYDKSRQVSKYLFVTSIPVGFVIAALARPLLAILAGLEYQDAILPFIVLSITASITVWYEALGLSLVQAVGLSRKILYSNVIAIGVGLVLTLSLVPFLGVIAAALARTIMQIMAFALLMAFAHKPGKEMIDKRALVLASVASAAASFLVYILDFLYPVDYLFPMYLGIGILAYLLMIRVTSILNGEDLKVISTNSPKALLPVVHLLGKIATKDSKHPS